MTENFNIARDRVPVTARRFCKPVLSLAFFRLFAQGGTKDEASGNRNPHPAGYVTIGKKTPLPAGMF